MFWEREGAFTGEVSAVMIKEAGAEFVIIGHSERRTLFGETDVTVNRKLQAALAAPLTPIVCIDETTSTSFAEYSSSFSMRPRQSDSAITPSCVTSTRWSNRARPADRGSGMRRLFQ